MRRSIGCLLTTTAVLTLPAMLPAWAPVSAAVWAQVSVSEDTTDPIETATVDDGSPGDVTIDSGVTVQPDSGTALTLNSSNTVINNGTITIEDADDAIGVLILGGNTGSFTNEGAISILEDFTQEDTDSDGDLDTGDTETGSGRAQGSGRVGILVEGSPFTGSLDNVGTVSVEGNDSAGIRIDGDIDGTFLSVVTTTTTDDDGTETTTTDRGSVVVVGDDSVGIDISGDISGDVVFDDVTVRGENSQAIEAGGDIGGAVTFEGAVSASAYRETSSVTRRTYDTIDLLDDDDLLQGGAGVTISGSAAGGVLVSGYTGDEVDSDDDGFLDDVPAIATISSYGSAPALLVTTNDDDANQPVTFGAVGDGTGHGLVVRGSLVASGVYDDVDASAMVIEGNASEAVDLAGGLDLGPQSQVTAVSYSSDATAISIGTNVSIPDIDNDGTIQAENNSQNRTDTLPTGDPRPQVVAIDIAAGAMAGSLINDGTITASVDGTTDEGDDADDTSDDTVVGRGDAYAIRDVSGTLSYIENADEISATTADEDGLAVALDLSNATADVLVNQLRRETEVTINATDDEPDLDPTYTVGSTPYIQGDIVLGAGNDTLSVQSGLIVGDIEFGAGADQLTIDEGEYVDSDGETVSDVVVVAGDITDADGQLSIDVVDGRLAFTNTGTVDITSMNIGAEGEVFVTIDASDTDAITATLINASAGVSVADGGLVDTNIVGLVNDSLSLPVISAADLSILGSLDSVLTETGFLYTADLTVSETDPNTLVLSLRRQTAEELGLDASQAAAYEPLAGAALEDEDFATILSLAADETEFDLLFNQLMPDFSDAALRFAIAFNDQATGAVGNRLNAVRENRETAGSVWLQEAVTFLDRETEIASPGYRGYGIGFTAGFDRPIGPFYAVGLNFGGFASQFETAQGYDDPLDYQSVTLGGYAATKLGPLLFDIHAGGGLDQYVNDRSVQTADFIEDSSFSRQTSANWRGSHRVAGARVSTPFSLGMLTFAPTVSADYVRVDEDGYSESGGDGIALSRDSRFMELGSASATLDIGPRFTNRIRKSFIQPRLRVGYREELFATTGLTVAQTTTGETFVLDVNDIMGSGPLAGLSLVAGSQYSTFALDYDAVVRDGMTRHSGRATFRLQF